MRNLIFSFGFISGSFLAALLATAFGYSFIGWWFFLVSLELAGCSGWWLAHHFKGENGFSLWDHL
jgi:hypothetical protein